MIKMGERMRLQKYMSQAWICSRRKAEEYISEGNVFVNGKVACIGDSIDIQTDRVEIGDKVVKDQEEYVYYKMNKPRGIITTCAEFWDKNIIDIIDIKQRVFPVGRLDKDTTWLILLTNDGRITNYLIHPRYEHEKEYIVEVFWTIDDEALEEMRKWVFILWTYTKEAGIKRIASWKFSIILTEWKNRQIRRMVEKVWSRVKKLKRIRIENIELGNLKDWQYKHLSKAETTELFKRIWLTRYD